MNKPGSVQRLKMARGWKFWIEKEQGSYYQYVANTKALISCTVTVEVICALFMYTHKTTTDFLMIWLI